MNDVVRPARPHHKLTADGRRMREVLTYSRRGNRFTPRQAESWAAHHADWVIPEEAVDRPGFALAESPEAAVLKLLDLDGAKAEETARVHGGNKSVAIEVDGREEGGDERDKAVVELLKAFDFDRK